MLKTREIEREKRSRARKGKNRKRSQILTPSPTKSIMSKVVANGNGAANGGKSSATATTPGTTTTDNSIKRLQAIVMLILFLSSAFFYKVAMQTQHNYNQHVVTTSTQVGDIKKKDTKKKKTASGSTGVSHVEQKTSIRKRNDVADAKCQQICTGKRQVRIMEHYNGYDILDTKQLLHVVETSINHMISTRLKSDKYYGEEYFEKIFQLNMEDYTGENEAKAKKNGIYPYKFSNGYRRSYRGVIPVKEKDPPSRSIEETTSANSESDGENDDAGASEDDDKNDPYLLLKRRLLIKVLQVQTGIRKEESNYMGCDCLHGDKALESSSTSATNDDSTSTATATSTSTSTTTVHINATQTMYSKFVWAAGGHSASAGHGNLFNESYTAYLDYFITPIFKSIGIEFVPRNYAMGGTPYVDVLHLCIFVLFTCFQRFLVAISVDFCFVWFGVGEKVEGGRGVF